MLLLKRSFLIWLMKFNPSDGLLHVLSGFCKMQLVCQLGLVFVGCRERLCMDAPPKAEIEKLAHSTCWLLVLKVRYVLYMPIRYLLWLGHPESEQSCATSRNEVQSGEVLIMSYLLDVSFSLVPPSQTSLGRWAVALWHYYFIVILTIAKCIW